MTDNEWALEYAERLTTRGRTYVPEDIANMLRLQVAKLEALRMRSMNSCVPASMPITPIPRVLEMVGAP